MGFFKKNSKQDDSTKLTKEELVEHNICPNCWGQQEYDGKFKQFVEDQTKGNVNHDKTSRKAFILQFVEKHVTGIKLKEENHEHLCPRCRKRY